MEAIRIRFYDSKLSTANLGSCLFCSVDTFDLSCESLCDAVYRLKTALIHLKHDDPNFQVKRARTKQNTSKSMMQEAQTKVTYR